MASDTVYLNGELLPREEALVPVDDRGFLFGDGVYEVTPAYRGCFFRLDRHLARMRKGLCELRIDFDAEVVPAIHEQLLVANGLVDEEVSYVYIQVTRGVAPRTHAFPKERVEPTVYAYAKPYHRPARDRWEEGYEAVTVPDRRWSRADLKTIALLPCCLAQQAAAEAGVADALMVKDGIALEGAHNNFFAVFGDRVATHPASNVILHGITREYILELAREKGYTVEERPVMIEELQWATEAFFTGTTTEVRPTVKIDGTPVGDGKVGPVTRTLFDAFLEGVERVAGGAGATGTAGTVGTTGAGAR